MEGTVERKKVAGTEKKLTRKYIQVDCKTFADIRQQLQNKEPNIFIHLTGTEYYFDQPLNISKNIIVATDNKSLQFISTDEKKTLPFAIQIQGGAQLEIRDTKLDLSKLNTNTFIITDTSGPSHHVNFVVNNSTIEHLNSKNGYFFYVAKSSMADSVIVRNSVFRNNTATLFDFSSEFEKKGICVVESINISNNRFEHQDGTILDMLRNGVDESTLGPLLIFSNNQVDASGAEGKAMLQLIGTQQSLLSNNNFTKTNPSGILIRYIDYTRASHMLQKNIFSHSGTIVRNKYVVEENDIVQ